MTLLGASPEARSGWWLLGVARASAWTLPSQVAAASRDGPGGQIIITSIHEHLGDGLTVAMSTSDESMDPSVLLLRDRDEVVRGIVGLIAIDVMDLEAGSHRVSMPGHGD